jgi:uncharacterized protein
MKNIYVWWLIPLLCISDFAHLLPAQGPVPAQKKPKQFIYVLHLVPRLHDDKAWTEQDKSAVERHFNRLKDGSKTGEVILAGRTSEAGDQTFGIVIFAAADENAARAFMNSDPAVVAGVMTAELHPFGVALERKNP